MTSIRENRISCVVYNRLINEHFAFSKKEGVDIYFIGLEGLQEALGINVA